MNANDIIEKCAEICDRYALENHEAEVKAGRRASRLLEIDSVQRETAEIGSVECESAALEAAAIANEIRALKSSFPAETASEAMQPFEKFPDLADSIAAIACSVHGLSLVAWDNHLHQINKALEVAALTHVDDEEAVAHAERMRAKKIVSLKKQIGKLETLTFSHPEAKATRP